MIFLFHYLSILNMIDAFATYFGLEYTNIAELNPIMEGVYNTNPLFFLFLKITLSVILYGFILFNKIPNTLLIKGIMFGASLIYSIVIILHLTWFLIMLF